MSLLREIQEAATSEGTDLSTVLRKCRILATRLQHDGFKQWTNFELDGYPVAEGLPKYRIQRFHSFGNFVGAFDRQARNVPIPVTSIPEKLRDTLTIVPFQQGVAALQAMVDDADKSTLQHRWPADASKLFGSSIIPGMYLMEAWNDIPVNFVVGILDTVRNRVLNFVLEIDEQNPKAGDVSSISRPMSQQKVQQIFNTTIHSNPGNLAIGSQNFNQSVTIEVKQGDFKELSKLLNNLGINDAEVKELQSAIKVDGQPKQNNFGEKVANWFGKIISKSAQGLLKVGSDVATSMIKEALFRYYGFHP
jgi:hypothetical protein